MTYTELVEKARELGVAIQDTDEFTAFIVAKTAADKSEKLQDKLGQFNLKKLDLNRAIIAEEKDNEKIAELNGEVKKTVRGDCERSPNDRLFHHQGRTGQYGAIHHADHPGQRQWR